MCEREVSLVLVDYGKMYFYLVKPTPLDLRLQILFFIEIRN